jgi:glutaminyl-peptide cyclotransferase
MPKLTFLTGCLLLMLVACNSNEAGSATPDATNNSEIASIEYAVVRSLPHDTTAFTEGLLFHDGQLFESTGSPHEMPQLRSVAGRVDTATGKIKAAVELDRSYFGEGIVFLNNKLHQLTYRKRKGFVYDAQSYKLLDSFKLASQEGWGMTTDSTSLIMSDGSCNISYLDPASYAVTKVLRVTDDDGIVTKLNELEYVNGFIYANIYTTNDIVKIDVHTGQVVAKLDGSSLDSKAKARYPGALEINGIAWNPASRTFFVTGKLWPHIYEISFPH